jgi:hypothetical protein
LLWLVLRLSFRREAEESAVTSSLESAADSEIARPNLKMSLASNKQPQTCQAPNRVEPRIDNNIRLAH